MEITMFRHDLVYFQTSLFYYFFTCVLLTFLTMGMAGAAMTGYMAMQK